MVYADIEAKRAYFRAYYHRKLGGGGKTYAPREVKNDDELLALAKEVFSFQRHECECGAVIASNRLETHRTSAFHLAGMRRKARQLEKKDEKPQTEIPQADVVDEN